MNFDYVTLFQGIFLIISAVVCSCLVPLAIKALGREKFNTIVSVAKVLTKAVEQTMGSGTGMAKKNEVLQRLQKMFPKVPYKDLESIMESAVYELNNIAKEITK